MKTTLVTSPLTPPADPWEGVTFPCLVEHKDGAIAIATSENTGLYLHSTYSAAVGTMWRPDSWRKHNFTPIKRPVTITFEP